MNIYIPQQIKQYTGKHTFVCDNTGMSGSDVLVFEDMVLKIEKHTTAADSTVAMMQWLQDRLPVPKIICYCTEQGKSYTLMTRIKGIMTCDEKFMEQQDRTVSVLADGLKMLWNTDITQCPRVISFEDELKTAIANARQGIVDETAVDFGMLNRFGISDIDGLIKWLKNNIPPCDPVLSHGDYCMPNVIVKNDTISGFIDLGDTAVADRYRDISMCYISLKNNYGGVFGGKVYTDFNPDILFEKLGVEPNMDKLNWYILLNELFKTK
ncbi:MAG: phosphotransferase [Oscillospiraceae bacterium]|nr:phosphotransferase [Oscillospiraceae bacterium]